MIEQLLVVEPVDAKDIAIDMEDDLCDIRHLARTIYGLASADSKDMEYGEEIICLTRMILEKTEALERQRAKAAGQLTPAEHSA
jgi:hypothetical protein